MDKLYTGYFLVDAWDSICLPRYETKEAAEKARKSFPNCRIAYLAEVPPAPPAAPPPPVDDDPHLAEFRRLTKGKAIVIAEPAAPPAGVGAEVASLMIQAAERLEADRDPVNAPSSAKTAGILALRLREAAKAATPTPKEGAPDLEAVIERLGNLLPEPPDAGLDGLAKGIETMVAYGDREHREAERLRDILQGQQEKEIEAAAQSLASPPAGPAVDLVENLPWLQQDFKDLHRLHPYPDPMYDALVRIFMLLKGVNRAGRSPGGSAHG